MSSWSASSLPTAVAALNAQFGERLQHGVPLARYTAARVGGPADWLLEVRTADELAGAVTQLWQAQAPFVILGGGSNVLVGDGGVREVVLINRAKDVRFEETEPPAVWAESGANFGALARQAGARGLDGLAWAAGIPGTLGGAVAGNAGAHGGDTAGNLITAEILHLSGYGAAPERQVWPVERFEFAYRTSRLKRLAGDEKIVVLEALLRLEHSTAEAVQAQMDSFVAHRRRTQPPGASMGSMFKNPPGDHAGRLIEAAGLKGTRIGDAEISPLHANFFINHGQARAADILSLIRTAQRQVADQSGVHLELEVELLGEYE